MAADSPYNGYQSLRCEKFCIKRTTQFKYLGLVVTNNIRKDLVNKIRAGHANFYSVHKLITPKLLSVKTNDLPETDISIYFVGM